MYQKHIRQILSELCNAQYEENELCEASDEEKKEAERKAKRLKRVTCIYCGSIKKSSLEDCDICETRKQMEVGEYI